MSIRSHYKSPDENSGGLDGYLEVDLKTFRIGDSKLGQTPSKMDVFTHFLSETDMFKAEKQGYEVGTKDGLLEYLFVTLDGFHGAFLLDGDPLDIKPTTTEADIHAKFGEPYWIDRDDGETILFYEYERGEIELQFEFSDDGSLYCITMMQNGVLSNEEQRKSYGVYKSWPPA